jgi:hypothetical protein
MNGLKSAKQVINMDEAENITLPENWPSKVVGYSRNTTQEYCQDCTDLIHVSPVWMIFLSGGALKLLFLPISDVQSNEVDLNLQRPGFLACKTPKRRTMNVLMTFYGKSDEALE